MTTIVQQQDDHFDKFAEVIENHLKKKATFHFRPMQIDGINIYIVLYGNYNLLNVEAIYIHCKVKINGELMKQKYSLYHHKYRTINEALQKAQEIKAEYRIYDGELVNAIAYSHLKLEEQIIPYSEDECCVVCYENTSDITECKHPICLRCREKCILQDQPDCPVCRSQNTLPFYTNRSGLVNNDEYGVVKLAIHSEKKNKPNIMIPSMESNFSDDYDSESESSDNESMSDNESESSDNESETSYDVRFREDNDAIAYYGRMEREHLRLSQTQLNDGEEIHLNEIPIVVEDHEDSEIDEISEFLGNV